MSKVSRSTYQKLAEENKRLKKDIEILVGKMCPEQIIITSKYRKEFADRDKFNSLLKDVCKTYVEQNKDSLPDFITKKV